MKNIAVENMPSIVFPIVEMCVFNPLYLVFFWREVTSYTLPEDKEE